MTRQNFHYLVGQAGERAQIGHVHPSPTEAQLRPRTGEQRRRYAAWCRTGLVIGTSGIPPATRGQPQNASEGSGASRRGVSGSVPAPAPAAKPLAPQKTAARRGKTRLTALHYWNRFLGYLQNECYL